MPGQDCLLKCLDDKAVKAYLEYQIDLAILLGSDRERATKEQTLAVQLEINLAEVLQSVYYLLTDNLYAQKSNIMQISRSAENLFYSLTVKELSKKVPGIPWQDYINEILSPYYVITKDERIITINTDYLWKLVDFLSKTPKGFVLNISI